MAKEEAKPFENPADDYELMPHRDIIELREELRRLREKPSEKTLQISMVELASRLDRITGIFEEAKEMIKVEEGALTFQEKMRPLVERMEKILEQNSQIAEGVVAIADMVNELKNLLKGEKRGMLGESLPPAPEPAYMEGQGELPPLPPLE